MPTTHPTSAPARDIDAALKADPPATPGRAAPGTPPGESSQAARGVAYGLAAYLMWGLTPIYFKAIAAASALEILAHRMVWGMPLLALLLLVRRRWGAVVTAVRSRTTLRTLAITTALIGANWYLFIWAVANDMILQVSLGYFMSPLVNVALGVLVLKESLSRGRLIGVLLAGAGVTYLTIGYGQIPWVALTLALTFGFYALLRKRAAVDAMTGLTIEVALLLPASAGLLVWLVARGESSFLAGSLRMDLLLPLAGAMTLVPLLWFTEAARRIRLTTLGFLQYIAPTGHFLLAVLVYSEPFTSAHLITFGCIWAGLAAYTVEAAVGQRRRRREAGAF